MRGRRTLEVLVERAGRDVLDLEPERAQVLELEALAVGREVQRAARCEQPRGQRDQLDMITLDVERAVHLLRVRERRRIAEDQVELRRS